jgi:hypothetical protein
MRYRVYQNKRTQVSFSHIRKSLKLSETTYTLLLFQGPKEVLRIVDATLGPQYLNSWTRIYDATQGKPLFAWLIAPGEIGFEPMETKGTAEGDVGDLVSAALRECVRRRTGVPIPEEALPPSVFKKPEIIAALSEASTSLGLGDLAGAMLTDDEVIAKLPTSWPFEGLHMPAERRCIAQRGRLQLYFRARMLQLFENRCAFCGCTVPSTLEAAHVFPWSRCASDVERIDDANGLLLCASHHRLFDAGDITIGIDLVINVDQPAGEGTEILEVVRRRTVLLNEREADFKVFLARRVTVKSLYEPESTNGEDHKSI